MSNLLLKNWITFCSQHRNDLKITWSLLNHKGVGSLSINIIFWLFSGNFGTIMYDIILEWSPWFVVKFWGRSKKFKILRFKNFLPKRLCRAATTKPRQLERSGFFLLDHNGKTWIYRLVPGSYDVPLQRKRDSPMGYDDCAPPRQVGLRNWSSLD